MSVKVKYVGGHDEVYFIDGYREREVKRDEVIEVSPRTANGDGTEGSGLLAQPDNWQLVESTTIKNEKEDIK